VNHKNTLLLSDILKINADIDFVFLFAHYYPLKVDWFFKVHQYWENRCILVYICGKLVLSLFSRKKSYSMFTLRDSQSRSQVFFVSNSILNKIKYEFLRIKSSN
jgi:hypothetical protein